MKKIVILTAGYGGGHNAAAHALARGLLLQGVEPDAVKVVDLLQSKYGKVNQIFQKAYLAAVHRAPLVWGKIYNAIDSYREIEDRIAAFPPLRKAMAALLELEKPAIVVSTFPVYNCLIAPLYRTAEGEPEKVRSFRQYTVVTDSLSINAIWYRCGCDRFFVPNEVTAQVLIRGGVDKGAVQALGFPVDPLFAEAAREEKRPPKLDSGERWRLLYALQPWQTEALATIEQLLRLPQIELTVTVAGNDALKASVADLLRGRAGCEVFGKTSRMPELIARSHLMIGKAGGAMVHEALAGRTPMIVTQVIPGQEEGNARLLVEAGCGAVAGGGVEIVALVKRIFSGNGAEWREWHERLLGLSYPNAAREIAQTLLSLEP